MSHTLTVKEVQYLSCCQCRRHSATFDYDSTVTAPDWLWTVMLRRVSKWRFIRSKVFLIEFVESNFADLTDLLCHFQLFYFYFLCSFRSQGQVWRTGLYQHCTVAHKCNVKHCWWWWLLLKCICRSFSYTTRCAVWFLSYWTIYLITSFADNEMKS